VFSQASRRTRRRTGDSASPSVFPISAYAPVTQRYGQESRAGRIRPPTRKLVPLRRCRRVNS
jgi:hypothetical protein